MNGLYAAAATVCAAAAALGLLSRFVSDGGTKRLLQLVMGAFMVCCIVGSLRGAVTGISAEMESLAEPAQAASPDEAYTREVLRQTKLNLEAALTDILAQNGIEPARAEVTLALTDVSRVIISQIKVTVGAELICEKDRIARLTRENFAIVPAVEMEREADG